MIYDEVVLVIFILNFSIRGGEKVEVVMFFYIKNSYI